MASNNKKYKVKSIIDSMVYGKEAKNQLLDLNYLVLWKNYPKEENIRKPLIIVIHLQKLINTFYEKYSEKLIVTFLSLDSILLIARPTILK